MRWIVLVFVLCIFGNSVPVKYAYSKPCYLEMSRWTDVVEMRPALPLVVYVNKRHPDGVLYQHWFDEYRAWFDCKVIGRRVWRGSWEDFHAQYPDSTARELFDWMAKQGVTHMMLNPHGRWVLPKDDPEFAELFRVEASYHEYELYALLYTDEDRRAIFNTVLDNITPTGLRKIRPDSILQE